MSDIKFIVLAVLIFLLTALGLGTYAGHENCEKGKLKYEVQILQEQQKLEVIKLAD